MQQAASKAGFFKKILVCVGEGGLSDHAVRAGAELAERFGAELDLLHVQSEPRLLGSLFSTTHMASWSAERTAKTREQLRAHLEWALSGVAVKGTPVAERLRVLSGSPSRVVLDEAKRTGADLILIGDSGKKKQLDFGGTARALLSHAPCPVWVQTQRPAQIRRIVAPLDLSPHSLRVLAYIVDFARAVDAKVTALHCFSATEFLPYGAPEVPLPPPVFTLEELRNEFISHFEQEMAKFDWKGVEHDTRFVDDDAARGILSVQYEYGLIGLGTHGHTGLAAALLGSVAYGVLRNAHTPVLAVRMDDKR